MGRDLLIRPYGRFYYLPLALAQSGHDVHLLLLDYGRGHDVRLHKDGIHWTSVSLVQTNPFGYLREANRFAMEERPDWIIGFSDTYFGILAQRLATRHHCKSLIDAYDNYESYIPWLKPLHLLWRNALANATLVSAAGPHLAEFLGQFRPGKPTHVIPMAADPIGFVPRDRQECRKQLGLPLTKKLIGFCGSIFPNRGIELLFRSYSQLRESIPDIGLVLSGRLHPKVTLPPNAHWLGYVPDDLVSIVINSLDVMVVTNRTSSFGNFSYPVKLYEAMSCQIPVVVTETPATGWILQNHPECLVPPDDLDTLCKYIWNALALDRVDYGNQHDWCTNTMLLENALVSATAPTE